jgi:hypothetical protein
MPVISDVQRACSMLLDRLFSILSRPSHQISEKMETNKPSGKETTKLRQFQSQIVRSSDNSLSNKLRVVYYIFFGLINMWTKTILLPLNRYRHHSPIMHRSAIPNYIQQLSGCFHRIDDSAPYENDR